MKYIALFLLLGLMAVSCKTKKPIVLADYDGIKITFGSGGGFAGRYIEHSILPNGDVYVKNNGKTFHPTKGIDSDVAQQMIDNYKNLGIDKIELQDPGNMTYFILKEEKGEKHKITWGAELQAVPQELKDYFRTLNMLVKDSKNPTK